MNLWTVARGINLDLQTWMDFEDDDNTLDPVMHLIEPVDRHQTLLAHKLAAGHYRFDIRLQGEGETVFLDV